MTVISNLNLIHLNQDDVLPNIKIQIQNLPICQS